MIRPNEYMVASGSFEEAMPGFRKRRILRPEEGSMVAIVEIRHVAQQGRRFEMASL